MVQGLQEKGSASRSFGKRETCSTGERSSAPNLHRVHVETVTVLDIVL